MATGNEGFSEMLYVPVRWWLLGALFTLAVGWAFYVATPWYATAVAVAITLVAVVALMRGYGRIRVATDPDGFSVGRALLPYGHVGPVEALDAAATSRLLGVEADARAYLVVRSYCGGSVKVMVDDPADPAPYWLVSTRHPEALAASLAARCVRD